MDWMNMTALELGAAIRSGETTSVQATEALFDAIAAKDGGVHAYVSTTQESALRDAAAADEKIRAGLLTGPLAGVPVAIKDCICEQGKLTTCASKILTGFRPPYSATVIDRLAAAGAVFAGKVNMDEFAMGSTTETSFHGPTMNPWDVTHVPGGSSGGAAAAVAARIAPYAIGSDTGGSIRQPASYCGVTGIKPTYGAVSRYGLIAYASSLDQMGPIARDAADCAAVLDVICGKDPRDGTSLEHTHPSYLDNLSTDLRGKRIGIPTECFSDGLDPQVAKAVRGFADTLKSCGAELEEFSFSMLSYAVPAYYLIACAEASSNLSRFDGVKYGYRAAQFDDVADLHKKTRSEGFGSEVKRRILLGTFALSTGYYDAYYKKALQVKSLIKQAFDAAFEKYDMILCPVAPTTAPRLGESLSDPLKMYLSDIYTVSVNLAGLPGISVPCGFDDQGMPIGGQLIGKPLGEQDLLNAAHAFQSVTEFHKKSPEGGAR
jgi:aspartyl-tRNA(Asn)/glutamyl-tRNA(Gln) amidotransferase subunit A